MYVTILNWDAYNLRKDVKAPSWFRMSHSIFDDHEFFGFSNSELLVWIYFLCIASKKSSGTIIVNFEHAEKVSNLKKRDVLSSIKKLEQIQCITVSDTCAVRERDVHGTQTSATLHNITLHNITKQEECSEVENPTSLAIEQLRGNLEVETSLKNVKQKTQELWLESYPDANWIKAQIVKAVTWISINPKKAPKKFDRFMNNWLSSGWEEHRKTIQSQRSVPVAVVVPILDKSTDPDYIEFERCRKQLEWR